MEMTDYQSVYALAQPPESKEALYTYLLGTIQVGVRVHINSKNNVHNIF